MVISTRRLTESYGMRRALGGQWRPFCGLVVLYHLGGPDRPAQGRLGPFLGLSRWWAAGRWPGVLVCAGLRSAGANHTVSPAMKHSPPTGPGIITGRI